VQRSLTFSRTFESITPIVQGNLNFIMLSDGNTGHKRRGKRCREIREN